MNSALTQKIIQLDNNNLAIRALRERRDEILGAIGDRTLEPSKEVMSELAEINIALGDFPAEDEAFQ